MYDPQTYVSPLAQKRLRRIRCLRCTTLHPATPFSQKLIRESMQDMIRYDPDQDFTDRTLGIKPKNVAAHRSEGYRGVTAIQGKGGIEYYKVRINDHRHTIAVGVFQEKQEAARAYDAAAIKLGRTTKLNFPLAGRGEDCG